MIELRDVTKTFNPGRPNAFTAVRHISCRIETRTVTILHGPSGSGKTTLLSLIGAMVRPTSGRIQVDGQEITSLPEKFLAVFRRKTFGFVFQNYNLISGISVLENVLIPAYPDGQSYGALKRKAMDLLDELQIASKSSLKVEHLSGGEQQRAAIARALINDPDVIIADEPTAHLDSALVDELLSILARFKAEGRTLLIASHDPKIYNARLVDHVLEMRDGIICSQELAA